MDGEGDASSDDPKTARARCAAQTSNSGHQPLRPPADWCPVLAVWTTRRIFHLCVSTISLLSLSEQEKASCEATSRARDGDMPAVESPPGISDAITLAGHRLQASWEHVFDVCAITEQGLRQWETAARSHRQHRPFGASHAAYPRDFRDKRQ